MKHCAKCNSQCYDIENYCIYCGTRLAPADIHCSYCGSHLSDLKGSNCEGCGAPLEIENYPRSLKLSECGNCKQGTPAEGSLYCAHCGVEHKVATSEATKKQYTKVIIAIILILVIPLIPFAVFFPMVPSETLNRNQDIEKVERSYKYAHFNSYTVSQIYDEVRSLEKYDWVEITGTITKYQEDVIYLDGHTPIAKFCVSGYPYDYTEGGRFDPDAFKVGEEVTIKGYIRRHPSSFGVEVGVFELY